MVHRRRPSSLPAKGDLGPAVGGKGPGNFDIEYPHLFQLRARHQTLVTSPRGFQPHAIQLQGGGPEFAVLEHRQLPALLSSYDKSKLIASCRYLPGETELELLVDSISRAPLLGEVARHVDLPPERSLLVKEVNGESSSLLNRAQYPPVDEDAQCFVPACACRYRPIQHGDFIGEGCTDGKR